MAILITACVCLLVGAGLGYYARCKDEESA